MAYFLEYAKSARARCRRCEDLIEKGTLRVGHETESQYGPGVMTTQWRHWGCLQSSQLNAMGVNVPGFHSLNADDQRRVVEAIKQRKILEDDLSPFLRPPLQLPADLLPSQSAPAVPSPSSSRSWAPSKKGKGSALMVPRKSMSNTSTAGPSTLQNAPSSSVPRASTSSSFIDLTSSPVKGHTASGLSSSQPASSQSQLIDLTSSPARAQENGSAIAGPSSQVHRPISSSTQPGNAARGRLVQAEDAESDEEGGLPEPADDVFYMRHQDEVVGIQHYGGLVGAGERVVLRRQPGNAYDSNAIQVINMNQQQVGHIPRGTAARLARLMDKQYINVEGVMVTGNIGRSGYKLKILLDIYGQPSSRDALAQHLAWAGSISETGLPPPTFDPNRPRTGVSGTSLSPKKGKGRSAPAQETEAEKAARKVMEGLKEIEKGDDGNGRDAVMDTLTKGFDVLKLPLHPAPPSRLTGELYNDLLPHQSQGLLWMQQRESPALPTGDDHVQLWQRKQAPFPHWLNLATLTPQAIANPPALGRGGIMGDAMGLGKTLTILALVIATKADTPPGYCGATLVVCPLSVLSNWEHQLEEHVRPGQLSSIVYYGDGRNSSQDELDSADIVFTTYDVLSVEATRANTKAKNKGKIGNLINTKWKRVVLDEGHTIRNPKAAKTKACATLVAYSRFVVSGTPIINSAKDLGSLLSFLRICKPLDEPEQFRRHILRNLASGDGASLLQAIMSHSCIRRTKEMQDENGNRLVPLPPVNVYTVKVDLLEEDRKAYDLAMAASKRKFEEFLQNDRTGALPPNVLQLLTRLRQLACLSTLVPPNYIQDLQKEEERHAPVEALSAEAKKALILKLKATIDDAAECPVCFDVLAQPRITMCGHCYCLDCISEVIQLQGICPMDRTPLPSAQHLLELPDKLPVDDDGDVDEGNLVREQAGALKLDQSSAKINELVKYLKAFPKGEKSLVFSQFTKFLEKIEPHLAREGIKCVRLDGSMSQKRRAEVIELFQNSSAVTEGDSDEEEEEEEPRAEPRVAARKSTYQADDDSATEVSEYEDDPKAAVSDDDDDDFQPVDAKLRKRKAHQIKGKRSSKRITKSNKGSNGNSSTKSIRNGPTVMLISLQAGSQGLNLTAAQNVFLIDPWWNSAITLQAIDRVNRIGQKAKEVRVFEIVANNTVEDKILEIQAKKNELIQQAFAGNRTRETARQKKEARFNEIAALFGLEQGGAGTDGAGGSRLVQQRL